jgi:amino acid permease
MNVTLMQPQLQSVYSSPDMLDERLLSDSKESHPDAASLHPGSHSSLTSATLTLTISAAGAGMLSFAYAVRMMGITSAIICTILFALLNAYTLSALARLVGSYSHRLVGQGSYEELVRVVLGQRWYIFCVATILLGGIGAMTGFLLIQCSLAHQMLWSLCTHTDSAGVLHNECGFWSSRAAIALLLCTFVIFPLSFTRSLHNLVFSTWLSFLTVISVMGTIVFRAIQAMASSDGYPHTPGQEKVKEFAGWGLNVQPEYLLGWPIIIFALGCQLQLPLVYLELHPTSRAGVSRRVVLAQTLLVVLLYLLTGVAGFLLYGSDTDGDILLNFSTDDLLANIAKGIMALHIALAFPVCLAPSRAALDFMGKTFWGIEPCRRNSVLQALSLIALSALLAVLIPEVQIVFGLMGSTISVSQTYLMPAVMLLALSRAEEGQTFDKETGTWRSSGKWDRWVAYGICLWSAVVCVLGTTSTIISLV